MMLPVILVVLLSVHHVKSQTSAPLVSGTVSCTAQTVTFTLDPSSYTFLTLQNISETIGVFVDNANTTCSDKPVQFMNPLSGSNYVVSISFEACNITIDALYGAQHKLLEYSATVYARLSPLDWNPPTIPNPTQNGSYPNVTFPISCNWLTGAQVTNNVTVNNNDPQPPPPVGNTTSPVDALNMTLTDEHGNPLGAVEAGTRVRVILKLSLDSFYKSELPEYCRVSNVKDFPVGTFIAVIYNYCPYQDTIDNSPFNFEAYQQDNNTYYFDFDTFTFNNQPTTLYINCYVQVCLNIADCYKPCWDVKAMSTRSLEEQSHYRQIPIQFDGTTNPPVDRTIRNGQVEVVPKSAEVSPTGTTSSGSGLPDWALILIIFFTGFLLFSLLICFCCCVCCGVGLGLWKRRGEKKHHHRTEYIYPQAAPPTYVSDNASIYHMEIPKVNLGSSSARSVTSDKSYKY